MNNELGRKQQSYGERLVRLDFNPSGSPGVDAVKATAAAMIDNVLQVKGGGYQSSPCRTRAGNIAITKIEEACMWAVKAITEEEVERVPDDMPTAEEVERPGGVQSGGTG